MQNLSNSFLLFLLLAGKLFSGEIHTVWLGWTDHPENRIAVHWLEKGHDPVSFSIRKDGSNSADFYPPPSRARPLGPYRAYWREVTDLEPDTVYELLFPGKEPYLFKTAPLSPSEPLIFIAGGDLYPKKDDGWKHYRKMQKVAAKQNPHFALFGGDLAYAEATGIANWKSSLKNIWYSFKGTEMNETEERWIDWISSWGELGRAKNNRLIPAIAILGNHDIPLGWYPATEGFENLNFFTLTPENRGRSYRVIDVGNYLSLLCLDSGHAASIGGEQAAWLEKVLAERNEVPVKIACYHVPAWPSVRNPDHPHSKTIRKHWVPLFEKYGVQIAFENHDHAFKRTHPLIDGKRNPRGVIYLGDGAWGVLPRKIGNKDLRPYLARAIAKRHCFLGTLTNGNLDIQALDSEGRVFDHIWLKVPQAPIHSTSPLRKL